MAQVPKPVFVIGDVLSSSYTTAIDATARWPSTSDSGDDEPVLICGTNDGSINLWSLSTYRCIHHYSAEQVSTLCDLKQYDAVRVSSIHVLPSTTNRRLLCQLKSNVIYLFAVEDRENPQLLCKWTSFATSFARCTPVFDNCFAFQCANKPDIIELVNTERTIKFCSIKLGKEKALDAKEDHGVVMAFHLFRKDITAVSGISSPEKQGLFLLVAYEDGLISLHRASLREPLETVFERTQKHSAQMFEAVQMSVLQSHPEMVTCIDFHEDSMRGVSCSVDNDIALWDVNIPETILNSAEDQAVTRGKFEDLVRNNKLGLVERKSKRITLTNAAILCCAIRPDGKVFATGGKDGRVRLFGLKTGKPLAILAYHSNTIESVGFSSNLAQEEGKKKYLLLASSRDKSISIWSLYND